MNYLIEAANERGLRQIAQQAMRQPQVHGIIVEVDPRWLYAYKIYMTRPDLVRLLEQTYQWYFDNDFPDLYLLQGFDPYFLTTIPFDLAWHPPFWDELRLKSNLRVKILLRPGSARAQIESGQLTLIQVHQPVPRLAVHGIPRFRPLKGGLSVGYRKHPPGTLGGILVDKGGKQYALTCAHVLNGNYANQPALADHRSSGSIGKVVFRSSLTPLVPGARCNAYVQGSNEMDVALVELHKWIKATYSIHQIGTIDGFMQNQALHPNLVVEYHGRTSGHKSGLVITGTGLFNEIGDAVGNVYCFKNLMVINDPSMFSLALGRPVKGGDSGAWIVGQGTTGTEWCGMIVGENRQTGYAITAESILDHLRFNSFDLRCK